MSETTNEQVCNTLARLSEKYPQLRVMQLIINAVPTEIYTQLNNDLYYVENEALLGWLLEYEQDIARSPVNAGTINEV